MLRGKRKEARGVSQSTEHYLRAIRVLRKERGYARISDVAEYLHVSAPTVSNMIRHLEEINLVQRDQAKFLLLSYEGERVAAGVAGRKRVMIAFQTEVLGMDPAVAERDACEMEHAISGVMFDRLIDLIKFMTASNHEGGRIQEAFARFRRACTVDSNACEECEYACSSVMPSVEHGASKD
jgi:DtxR family Mn-dependent transcriptional regulator